MTAAVRIESPTTSYRSPELAKYASPAFCVIVVIALFAVAFRAIGGPLFPNDDAYIALHNAQVVRAGYDSAYRGVPALIGATSGAHLALLALVESFIPSGDMALFTLCGAIASAYVVVIYAMGLSSGLSRSSATLLALACLFIAGSFFQFLNGLDTGLAMTAVACDLMLLSSNRNWRWVALLAGVMPFIRPELALLSCGSMFILLREYSPTLRQRMMACGLACAAGSPFLVWYWVDTGSLIPSTLAAKSYFYAEAGLPIAATLPWFLRNVILGLAALFPLFLCVGFIRPRSIEVLCLSFVTIMLAAYFSRLPLEINANAGRYLFIFVPVVIYGVVCALSAEARWKRLTAAACITAAVIPTVLALRIQYLSYVYFLNVYRPNLVAAVDWANAHLPVDSTVMIHDAGYAGYAGHFRLVDLVGLKTPEAVDVHRRLTSASGGAQRPEAIAAIADAFRPCYLIAVKSWIVKFKLVDALQADGWQVATIYNGRAAPRDSEIYQIFALRKSPAADGQP